MLALIGAVVAGALTTLAPCVLSLLPVIVGRTVIPGGGHPVVVTVSLGISVIVFTLALKASTALIGVPREVWQVVSGGLLVVVGISQVWPRAWEAVASRLGLGARAGEGLAAARRRRGPAGDVLTGLALGPVFSSCSPLYGYVVVTVLPAEFGRGLLLLVAYTIGLTSTLLFVALLGRRGVARLHWAADPQGWPRRALGGLLLVVGVLVLTGADQDLQAWILEHSPLRPWELDEGFLPAT